MTVSRPSVAQYNRGWMASTGIRLPAFVTVIVVFVLALQESRKGHRPVNVVALELEFI